MLKQNTLLPKQIGDAHLRLLRIYKAVVECQGFSGAEVVLNISLPAISQAITELESLLKLRLCSRGRAGFSVTEQGNEVYQATLTLLGNIENFRTQMNAINSELRGELNIGINDSLVSISQMKITKALASLKTIGPDIIINISMLPPAEIEAGVLDGHLHVGIIPKYRTLAGLNYASLYRELSVLYCANTHPLFDLAEDKLNFVTLMDYDAVTHRYPQSELMKDAQSELRTTASANGREGIAFLVLSGKYIGYLPTHYAEHGSIKGTKGNSTGKKVLL